MIFVAWWLNYFIVGLTNVSPTIQAPVLWQYTVCGQYPAVVPVSANANLKCTNCTAPYRYLIVQVVSNCFSSCEIQVYLKGEIGLIKALSLCARRRASTHVAYVRLRTSTHELMLFINVVLKFRRISIPYVSMILIIS